MNRIICTYAVCAEKIQQTSNSSASKDRYKFGRWKEEEPIPLLKQSVSFLACWLAIYKQKMFNIT